MWDKSIPKRALILSIYTSALIFLMVLIPSLFGSVIGTPYEIALRGITALILMLIAFWFFFVAYLIFFPNFDGYLDKLNGGHYGSKTDD